MKTLLKRLASETPKFWRKALKLGITLTAISAGLLVAPDGIEAPEMVQKAASYLATAGFVLTVVAKATTTDAQLSEK